MDVPHLQQVRQKSLSVSGHTSCGAGTTDRRNAVQEADRDQGAEGSDHDFQVPGWHVHHETVGASAQIGALAAGKKIRCPAESNRTESGGSAPRHVKFTEKHDRGSVPSDIKKGGDLNPAKWAVAQLGAVFSCCSICGKFSFLGSLQKVQKRMKSTENHLIFGAICGGP